MRRRTTVLLSLVLVALLAGCGGGSGGGSGDNTNSGGFGLASRAALAALNLPFSSAGTLGSYQLVNAFPGLNFSSALFLAQVPGESRLAVVQQSGFLRVFDLNAAATTSNLVLNLSPFIGSGFEEGLLGLAFDPDFTSNRYIYVHYSVTGPRRSRISRFTWDAMTDQASLASEKVLLEVSQPFSNHNGGMLAFGSDDLLYIAFGDGGSGGDPQNNAQDNSNLLGTIVRIDPHPANAADPYDIPLDNPMVGAGGGVREEIWAYGLRNPFRFSFDRQTGDLWLGDVGQGALEEIDVVTAGGNYGWRVYEGTNNFDGSANTLPVSAFTFPVFEYGRGDGVAIIGGYVYRGTDNESLQGRYLYTDFGSGTIWALTFTGTGNAVTAIANDVIASTAGPTSFGEDADGELYIIRQSGQILRIEETAPGSMDLPVLLSETGLFTDVATLSPASGLIEYNLNQPFWSDGAVKRRWLAIPDLQQIDFEASDAWVFPVGSIIVKHFEILLTENDPASSRRLETRLLINTSTGWEGYTYRWNAMQTDATLISGRESETITINLAAGGTADQTYEYPGRADCATCHNAAAGFVLGANTAQMNRDFAYPLAVDNQLDTLNHIELFDSDIGSAASYAVLPALDEASASIESRARAYLEVNCAQCHRPGGPTPTAIDLRINVANNAMGAIDVAPLSGDLGLVNARIIAAGEKERSVLWERMRRLDANRMPPIASHVVDQAGVELVGQWIDSL